MTAPIFLSLGKTAARMLTKFGGPLTVKRTVMGAYNPATGVAATTTTTSTVNGLVLDFAHRQIDGAIIKAGDRRVLLAGNELAFTLDPTTDRIVLGGVDHVIVHVNSPVNEPVLVDVQVRGAS